MFCFARGVCRLVVQGVITYSNTTDLQLHYTSLFFVSVLYKKIILIMYLVWSFKVNSNKFLVLINKTDPTSITRSQI